MSQVDLVQLLIVEDSNTQAAHLQAVLESKGYAVDWAMDAESAMEQLAKKTYDMVLTDIEMPGMSGYELCKIIKHSPEWRYLPVILLTSHKNPKNIILGLECGCDSFFTKPYEPKVIFQRIEQLLYNRRLRSSGTVKLGMEIILFGKVITINSEKEQILDMLVSSFEEMIQTNATLEENQKELAHAKRKIEQYIEILENRVRTSEERYRAIFDRLAEGIMICDQQGTVESVNPAILDIFSCSDDDISSKNIAEFFPSIELPLDSWLADAPHRYTPEIKTLRADGETIYVSVSISRVGERSNPDYVCLVQDRSKARRAEERLRQTEKMEAVGQLTGGIAHDYNNQLTVIQGAVEELKESGVGNEESTQLLELIDSAANAGVHLTRRLLNFSRSQPVESQRIDVHERLQFVKDLMNPLLGRSIDVTIEQKTEPCWPVTLDSSEFENAMLNLSINARDAMIGGGEISISIENTVIDDELADELGEINAGDYVLISFSDNGSGMPRHIQKKVFEPFFTTKAIGKGTGMGLAMVYGFVKQAGGQMKLHSELNVGTTFNIYLPRCNDSAAKVVNTNIKPSRNLDKLKILLVDGEPMIRQLAVKQLSSLGHEVDCVDSVWRALDSLNESSDYDLLMIDVVSNELNSNLNLLNELPTHERLRIVLTSGYFHPSSQELEIAKHHITFLHKPYNRAQLTNAIDRVMCEETSAC